VSLESLLVLGRESLAFSCLLLIKKRSLLSFNLLHVFPDVTYLYLGSIHDAFIEQFCVGLF